MILPKKSREIPRRKVTCLLFHNMMVPGPTARPLTPWDGDSIGEIQNAAVMVGKYVEYGVLPWRYEGIYNPKLISPGDP